jgi:methanol--5-hydroxybenzimidazolylcobamide Co-methyltransferase
MEWKKSIIEEPEKLMFGKAPKPVTTRRGLDIGGGRVDAELIFTLPMMSIHRRRARQLRFCPTDKCRQLQ